MSQAVTPLCGEFWLLYSICQQLYLKRFPAGSAGLYCISQSIPEALCAWPGSPIPHAGHSAQRRASHVHDIPAVCSSGIADTIAKGMGSTGGLARSGQGALPLSPVTWHPFGANWIEEGSCMHDEQSVPYAQIYVQQGMQRKRCSNQFKLP
eukprot:scaffold11853_cov18-Tisochrysis_lutea.AAC.2